MGEMADWGIEQEIDDSIRRSGIGQKVEERACVCSGCKKKPVVHVDGDPWGSHDLFLIECKACGKETKWHFAQSEALSEWRKMNE